VITFRLREDKLRWLESGEEVVAFDEMGAAYFGLNPAGSTLWRRLAGGASHEDLVAALVDEFEIDAEHAAADVDAFLQQLDAAELLERA
jgi:Coenzyme PQQ synthesis protein D (PqqD)